MSSPSLRRLQICIACIVALCAGCGPFGYLKKVAKDASNAVAQAEAVEAEKYAPYEYWGAVSYLEQAKIMMAYSEYERSFDYGTRAMQLAEEAKKKTEMREAGTDTKTLQPSSSAGSQTESEAAVEAEAADGGAKLEAGGSIGGGR